jgi:ribonucleotide monophosphatase NagD (HAD superfamily)
MVCVAAVALGLSTYAWFVSNNNVDAITTDISAQFNSAYLVIQEATADKTATDNTSESSATATEAVTNQYAHKDTFYIGTGGYDGSFTNLKVEDVKVSAKDNAKADLVNATETTTLTAKYTDATNKAIAASVSQNNDVTVDIYVFYDGTDGEVNSDNLADLKDCGVTVTFTATPSQPGNKTQA